MVSELKPIIYSRVRSHAVWHTLKPSPGLVQRGLTSTLLHGLRYRLQNKLDHDSIGLSYQPPMR